MAPVFLSFWPQHQGPGKLVSVTWPSGQRCNASPMPFPSSSLLGITFLILGLVRAIWLPGDSWETPRSYCQGNIKCLNEHIPVGTQPAAHLGPPHLQSAGFQANPVRIGPSVPWPGVGWGA